MLKEFVAPNGVHIVGPEHELREEIYVTETVIADQEMLYKHYCDNRNRIARAISVPKDLKQTEMGWRIERASRVVLAIEEELVRMLVKKEGMTEATQPYIDVMTLAVEVRNQCASAFLPNYEAYKATRRPEDYERANDWYQRMNRTA